MDPRILVRPEEPEDAAEVFLVNRRAFPTEAEARLVAALRREAEGCLSLVAGCPRRLVGHAFFSPVTVVGPAGERRAMALGPMAVLPEHQRQGIGSRLVEEGLAACRERGESLVFVLGHAAYYPRFGFRPAAGHGLRYKSAEFDPHFFVAELAPGALKGVSGEVRYHPAFDRDWTAAGP